MPDPPVTDAPAEDFDALVIGGGHNGLVTAAYLARAGMRTIVLEARREVGGTAGSETFGGATVNICSCDHLSFRATPIADELDLAAHGLRYLDVDPALHHLSWTGGPVWSLYHSVDDTLTSLAATYPDQVDGYRRYARAARPVVDLILATSSDPPTITGLTRAAVRRRLAGLPNLFRWSRRSAISVLGDFFDHDAVAGPAGVSGPMVWGADPGQPGTGMAAVIYAMKHAATLGRPIGGSGMLPTALASAVRAAGGVVRTGAMVDAVLCEGDRVRGVRLADGQVVEAPVVVSACNPHRTFLEWLTPPPAAAERLIRRWRAIPREVGYESKIDAILTAPLEVRGFDQSPASTMIIAPTLAEQRRGHRLISDGRVLEHPAMLVSTPTVLDQTMAPAEHPDRHVFSLEALFTPYDLDGGWPGSAEPQRWLEVFAEHWSPGLLDSIDQWRVVTPDVYEREFHLPFGHATTFAGGPLAVLRARHPELTRYETSVRGLYLTGAATFPGAGIWGASGRNCATVVLARHGG